MRKIKLKLKSGTFIRNLIKKCEVELNHVEKTTNETKKQKNLTNKKKRKQAAAPSVPLCSLEPSEIKCL